MLQRRGAPAHAAGFKLLKSKNGQRVNQPVCTGGVVVLEIVHREDFPFDKEKKKKIYNICPWDKYSPCLRDATS